MPLDKDIVREMWVVGDLKDRLGIQHRRGSKRQKTDRLEFTPMFHEPHTRSVSEVSILGRNQYEPTLTRSPGLSSPLPSRMQDTSLLDTPPLSKMDDVERQTYFVTKPSMEIDTSRDAAGNSRSTQSVSPQPSYYSASDIPEPSPIPGSVYKLTTGEITNSPPPRAGSSSVTVNVPSAPPSSSSHTHTLQPPLTNYGHGRRSTGSEVVDASNPEVYEMRIRSPRHDRDDHNLSPSPTPHSDSTLSRRPSASDISYATAEEEQEQEWWEHENHDQDHALSGPHHHSGKGEVGDDRLTIRDGDDDRPVSNASWDGGLAV